MYTNTFIAGCFEQVAEQRASPESLEFSLSDVGAWREYFGAQGESASGVAVTKEKAISIAAFWQGVAAKSHDAARIPLCVFRKLPDNGSEQLSSHPASRLIGLYEMANDELTAYQLWRRAFVHAILWGNGYIWIERRGARPIGLYNLLPDRTTPARGKRGRKYVVTEFSSPDGAVELTSIPYEDVIHIEGMTWDDQGGIDMVRAARDQIGEALARRNFQSKFFKNNASLGGVLQVPPGTAPEKIAKIEKTFDEKHGGSEKAFKVAVLRDGVKFHSTMATLQQSDASALDEQTARQVARFLNMPPGRLGVRESVSYNSQEADRRNYYDTSLTELLIPAATQCHVKLLTPEERSTGELYVRHKVAALLWADAKTVNEIGVAGVNAGIYLPDEVRGWFEMNPLPDGAGSKPKSVAPSVGDIGARLAQRSAIDSQQPQMPDQSQARDAWRGLLDSTFTRAANRFAVHVAKARRSGSDLETAINEQRDEAAKILEPVLSVASAMGLRSTPAADAVGAIVEQLRAVDWSTDKMDRSSLLAIFGL